jgi:hypothetical protein
MDIQLIPALKSRFKARGFAYEIGFMSFFCSDSHCPCTNAELYFYREDNGEKLFKINIDYDAWRVNSTEIHSDGDADYFEIISEFMRCYGEETETTNIFREAARNAVLAKENALKDDIDFSVVNVDRMVYYSDIYNAGVFRQISFTVAGNRYFVLDDYCVNPRCNCSDIVLAFFMVTGMDVKGKPVLVLKLDIKKKKYKVAEKNPEITDVNLFYKSCLDFFEFAGFDGFEVFKKRYALMRKWGETMYDRLCKKSDGEVLAGEMTDALPLYCYADKNSVALLSRKGLRINVNTRLEIGRIDYLGDEGGIMCAVKTPGGGRPLCLSASYLVFKDNGEIYDKINRYKEERIKWLRQEEEKDRLMGRNPSDMYKMVETNSDGTMTFFDDEGEAGMVVFPKNNNYNRPVTTRKISRNAPCPCGSGKKYKKCCADKM